MTVISVGYYLQTVDCAAHPGICPYALTVLSSLASWDLWEILEQVTPIMYRRVFGCSTPVAFPYKSKSVHQLLGRESFQDYVWVAWNLWISSGTAGSEQLWGLGLMC